MNPHELLLILITDIGSGDCDEKLSKILNEVHPHIQSNQADTKFVNAESDDVRFQYVRALVHVLQTFQAEEANDSLSVSEFKRIKLGIELITSFGIHPCLLPGIGRGSSPKPIADLQKYQTLSFTTTSLTELYRDVQFRPAILSRLGSLLAGLLQLHCAPLTKPEQREFAMTVDLYNQLKEEQEQFGGSLDYLLTSCPQSMIVKELMLILGRKSSPSWLSRKIRRILVEKLMQRGGVALMISAVCEDDLDFGQDWNKLDTVARLIAVSHVVDSEEYYRAICPQILELLSTKEIKHASIMANCCITALYNHNSELCATNIINVICEPLLVQGESKLPKSESEVERSIEDISKLFLTSEANFKQLPSKLISKVALQLFTLYNKTRSTPVALKTKLKQLLLRLLSESDLRFSLFAGFLCHDSSSHGTYLKSNFGPTGGLEITGVDEAPSYEDHSETLASLVSTEEDLSRDLFTYLLKFLSCSLKSAKLLENEEDLFNRLRRNLTCVKLLSELASTCAVQVSQSKNPEELFAFVKFLFEEHLNSSREEVDCELLYLSLMLVKLILEKATSDLTTFKNFAKEIKEYSTSSKIPEQLTLLIREVVDFIEEKGGNQRFKSYQDLSVDSKTSSKFDEALKDLADPFLPVRAHGIIVLTRLIEIKDPCAIARKAIVLRLLQENLKHEDSFLYLAAINGYCALATMYPEIVLPTLVEEFVKLPQRISCGSLSSETRMKLGEVLVKTTRSLGEMATPHKELLVNGFLCGANDSDPLVRASSLSCLGELCKVLGFRLGNTVTEVIYCISCIVKSDKSAECRRAAVLVATLLLRGLGKDALTALGKDLLDLYRGLKHLRDTDQDPVLRLHTQVALEELDLIVRDFLFATPKLEKGIFLNPTL